MLRVSEIMSTFAPSTLRRDGRVVDCTCLENRRTAMYPGFESLSLRGVNGGAVGLEGGWLRFLEGLMRGHRPLRLF